MAEAPTIRALRSIITSELCMDLRTNPISMSMEDGAICLEGTVERIGQKKRTLLAAMRLSGEAGVIDRLRVRPARTMTDAEIASHIYNELSQEPVFEPGRIEIEVRNGIVDLEGVVGSLSHKRLAGVFAWWTPGSADVINSLEVEPFEEDNDDEVTDALRLVLEKDRLVNASEIKASTRDWVVTLEGLARNNTERNAAEDDAWYVWGVNEVINRIAVED